MSLSIITPHFNDLEGLKQIYACLLKQTDAAWEWIVVDDLSNKDVRANLEYFINDLADKRIQLILNTKKSNASVCRNIGAETSTFNILVFLDSDDLISPYFVMNRQVGFKDFAVFKHTAVIDKNGKEQILHSIKGAYLNYFLKAQFIWPVTSVLWDKPFFKSIGKFSPKLPRLQDVELSIRALQNSSNYTVLDNTVDFYYRVKPIRERNNFVKPVCEAVHIFITELLDTTSLSTDQLQLLSGYYFQCVKYLERSESTKDIGLVASNLKLFYKKKYISHVDYFLGYIVLKFYAWRIVSPNVFLRTNRYLFKPR